MAVTVPAGDRRRKRSFGAVGISVLGGLTIAIAASGVTVAVATNASGGYIACANAHGVLALAHHSGKCAKGSYSVRIGDQNQPAAKAKTAHLPHMYENYGDGTDLYGGNTEVGISSLKLPLGHYDLRYAMSFYGDGASAIVECNVTSNDGLVMPQKEVSVADGQWVDFGDDTAANIEVSKYIDMGCKEVNPTSNNRIVIANVHLIAVPVSAIN